MMTRRRAIVMFAAAAMLSCWAISAAHPAQAAGATTQGAKGGPSYQTFVLEPFGYHTLPIAFKARKPAAVACISFSEYGPIPLTLAITDVRGRVVAFDDNDDPFGLAAFTPRQTKLFYVTVVSSFDVPTFVAVWTN